jgi:tetratricopeptide (TPR) repeat protein
MLPLTPKALFVGREEETQAYLNFLGQEKQWIFLITGMPGQGKSRFLTHLSTSTPTNVLTVKLDFANRALQIEPFKILEEVAWRTESHCDAARADLFTETLQDARKKLVEMNFEVAYHLRGPMPKLDVDTKHEIENMSLVLREQVLQAFYAQLSTFHTGRLVLMFDTCEWLNEPDGIETGNWFKDTLLPGLHRYVPVSLYIALASRIHPPLDNIASDEQRTCELRSLDDVAVKKYMELLGIEHQAQWHDLFALAHGHPLCMSIIATLWQERQDDRTNSDFPLLEKKFTEQAAIEFFQQRLDRRLKFPFRELTHYGVLLRSFDAELLRAVFPELLGGPESKSQFEQFISYSFIEEQGLNRYALHVLLREVMVQTIRTQEPEKWEIYHRRAYLYYHEHNSPEQYYHAIALDERKGMSDWQEKVLETLNTAHMRNLQLLFEIPHDYTLKLSEHGEAIYAYVRGQYHASARRWSQAFTHYEQALTLFRKLNDVYYEICVLQAIGDVKQSDQNRWQEALAYYHQALDLTRKQGNSTDEAHLLRTIGKVKLNDKNQWSDVLNCYHQALNLFRIQRKAKDEAQVLQAIGNVKQSRNRTWKKAIEYYQQALHIFQSLQDTDSIITILLTMGDVYQRHGRQKQALENFQQALQQHQQLDTQHITSTEREGYFKLEADLYERIGKVLANRGVTQKAEESYQQSLTLYQHAKDSTGEIRILQALHKSQKLAPFRRLFVTIPRHTQFLLVALTLLLIGGCVGSLIFWRFAPILH